MKNGFVNIGGFVDLGQVDPKWEKMYPIGSHFIYNSPYGGTLILKVECLYADGILCENGYKYHYGNCKPLSRYEKLKRIIG